MDPLQIFTGRYLLEILGACLRFIYLNIMIAFKEDGDFIVFSEILSPKGNTNKKNGNSERNHMIGVIFLGGTVLLLIVFNS
nr:hypothetical protein [uncultured Flavobacterium sp.]